MHNLIAFNGNQTDSKFEGTLNEFPHHFNEKKSTLPSISPQTKSQQPFFETSSIFSHNMESLISRSWGAAGASRRGIFFEFGQNASEIIP